jgi:hypothetical protein
MAQQPVPAAGGDLAPGQPSHFSMKPPPKKPEEKPKKPTAQQPIPTPDKYNNKDFYTPPPQATGSTPADAAKQTATQYLNNYAQPPAQLTTYQDVYVAKTVADRLGTPEAQKQWQDTSTKFLSASNQLALEKEVAARGATGPTAVTANDVMSAAQTGAHAGASPDAADRYFKTVQQYNSPENQRLLSQPDIRGPNQNTGEGYINYARTVGQSYTEGNNYNTEKLPANFGQSPSFTDNRAPGAFSGNMIQNPNQTTTLQLPSGGTANFGKPDNTFNMIKGSPDLLAAMSASQTPQQQANPNPPPPPPQEEKKKEEQ